MTPTMEAGIADHIWSIKEILVCYLDFLAVVAHFETKGPILAMSEEDYISTFRAAWPRTHEAKVSLVTMTLADEAVRVFPQSPRLWVIRGNLIELGPESTPYTLQDALLCYQRAVELDPKYAEAWDEIGHFQDAVMGDEKSAQKFFRQAGMLRGKHAA
jgi:hypothetical protein